MFAAWQRELPDTTRHAKLTTMKWLGGSLVFAAELSMFAGLFWWGYTTFDGYWGWLVGLSIPFFVSVVWSLSLSPRAPRPLPTPAKITTRLVLLLVGAAAWWLADQHIVAIITAVFALVGTYIAERWPFDMPGVMDAEPHTAPPTEEP
jgi:hypothetical protein